MPTQKFNIKKEIIKLQEIKEAVRLTLHFNKYNYRFWKISLAIFILGNFSVVLGLINPYLGKMILDKGILGKDIHSLLFFSVIAGSIFVMSLTLSIFYDYLKNYAITKLEVDLFREVFRRIKAQSLGHLQSVPSAVNLFRINNDIVSAATVINVTVMHFLNAVLKIIFITLIIFWLNPLLLLIVFAYQFLSMLRVGFLTKPLEQLSKLGLKRSEVNYRVLGAFFSHIHLFKAFGTTEREIRRYMHEFLENLKLAMRRARFSAIVNFISSIADKLFFGILSFYGSVLVIQGKISLGTLGAALMYIGQGVGAYSAITDMVSQLVLNKVPLERLTALLEQPLSKQSRLIKPKKPENIRNIEFKNVTFAYSADKNLLENMNFEISPGAHIGLVGYSGCGKTTLLNLMLGLYEPKQGDIVIGGEDSRAIETRYLLENIGIVLQEPFLLDDTIAGNISYALKKASKDDINQAAELVGATDFVKSLPNGFDTEVGENAYRLSQGQKQRLAIARAIIKKPQVLILDESMSSLDPLSEAQIVEAIRKEFRESTIILVSHRLSAIEKMDLVYFFESPGVMRFGKHNCLLTDNSKYRDFFIKINYA